MQQGNAVPISHTEFQPIARHYPIVFTTGDAGKSYAAVAVLGLSGGENLFYGDGAGRAAPTSRPTRGAIHSAWRA